MEHRYARVSWRTTALTTVAALAIGGIAACGGGDDNGGSSTGGGGGGKVKIGLITKTETNPFFVKMKEGAQAEAQKDGAAVQSFAGKKTRARWRRWRA